MARSGSDGDSTAKRNESPPMSGLFIAHIKIYKHAY